MIVKVDDPENPDGYVLLLSLQDLDALKAIFRSGLCDHNEYCVDNTDEAVAIIDVIVGSSLSRWRVNFEKWNPRLRSMMSKVKGLSSDLPETLEEIEDEECIYYISFKNIKGGIRIAYRGFGTLDRDGVGYYLGISVEEGYKMFDCILDKK